jgi:hypothetical protein
MNGILADRNGLPMTAENLQSFLTPSFPPENCPVAAKAFMDLTGNTASSVPSNEAFGRTNVGFMLNEGGGTSSREGPTPILSFMPGWKAGQIPVESTRFNSSVPATQNTNSIDQTTDTNGEMEAFNVTVLGNGVAARPWTENTPSSDSSSSNTRQYPYRQVDPSNYGKSMDYGIFQADMVRSSTLPPDWIMQEELAGMANMDSLHPNDGFDEFIANAPWAQGTRQD